MTTSTRGVTLSRRAIGDAEAMAALELADTLAQAKNASERLTHAGTNATEVARVFRRAVDDAIRHFDQRRHAAGIRLY